MRFVNSAERYGIKIGIEKGVTKGRREGRRQQAIETVLLLITHKLGQVNEETTKQVQSLPLTRLKKLTIDLLDFAEQKDLLAWLRQQQLSRG